MHRTVFALFLLPGLVAGQVLVQQGIAATSGTLAGTVLGKQLSDSLDGVRKAAEAAAEQGEKAVRAEQKKRDEWKKLAPKGGVKENGASAASAAPPPGAGASGGIAPEPRPRRARASSEPAGPSSGWPLSGWVAALPETSNSVVRPPLPVETTAAELRAVETGVAREQVVERLGTPVARVTIPEEGRFREVYYYHSNGEPVGAVQIVNGSVTGVVLNR